MNVLNLKRMIHIIGPLIVLIVAFGCNQDDDENDTVMTPSGERDDNEVWILDLEFIPETLTVAESTTVIWVNQDVVDYRIRSGAPSEPTQLFNSETFGNGETFSFTFNSVGTYPYFCELHPEQMIGTVIVQ